MSMHGIYLKGNVEHLGLYHAHVQRIPSGNANTGAEKKNSYALKSSLSRERS